MAHHEKRKQSTIQGEIFNELWDRANLIYALYLYIHIEYIHFSKKIDSIDFSIPKDILVYYYCIQQVFAIGIVICSYSFTHVLLWPVFES